MIIGDVHYMLFPIFALVHYYLRFYYQFRALYVYYQFHAHYMFSLYLL